MFRTLTLRLFIALALAGLLALPAAPISPPQAEAAPPPGTWQCWNDGAPDPCHHRLREISMVPGSNNQDGWAVGDGGTILRWNGSAWVKFTSPTASYLDQVDMLSSTDGWITGSGGLILRWNGTAWTPWPSPVSSRLYGLDMVSATDGWAVGENGVILRWNGSSWSIFSTSVTSNRLYYVEVVSANDVWAVGESDTIIHWNGSSWSVVPSPTTGKRLFAVDMLTPNDGWAVASDGVVMHWNGTSWTFDPSWRLTFNWVHGVNMVATGDVWAVATEGIILHWDGTGWARVDPSPTMHTLRTVLMMGPDDGWIIGVGGTILRWNGSTWNVVTQPPVGALNEVSMASAGSGWAAGDRGSYFWNGTTWTFTGSPRFYGVDMVDADLGWAVGSGGIIYRRSGASWFPEASQTTSDLQYIQMLNGVEGWAVGNDGAILRRTGSGWSQLVSPVTGALHAVDVVAANDGWAVGTGGAIVRWNGTQWTSYAASPTMEDLHGLDMLSTTDGWAVGHHGTILRWDGSSWYVHSTVGGNRLHSVKMLSSSEGWATGEFGTVLYWDGTTWQGVSTPAANDLYSIHMLSAGEGWAVGLWGTVLHYTTNGLPDPVQAAFTATPTSGTAPLTVRFSNGSTGDYTSLTWDFGDGGTSNAVNPEHEYAGPGVYTVSLTAGGPGGTDTETKAGYITVNAAPTPVQAAFSAEPTGGPAPLFVQFTNASTGDWDTLSWDFGDGSPKSSEISPTHEYTSTGTYTVSLTASGSGGNDTSTLTDYITVYAPVQTSFTGAPRSGPAPLQVQFTNESTGDWNATAWDFGDGTSSVEPAPVHSYTSPGTYTVTLTVSGLGGTDTSEQPGYIVVESGGTPAQVDFTALPRTGSAPLAVQFTSTVPTEVTSVSWDFGDGTISDQLNPVHTYATAGSFDVTLTAGGETLAKPGYIIVAAPNQPVDAAFEAAPTSGAAPLAVQFSNTSTGDYSSSLWDFGDGTTSELNSPQHTYAAPGVYTVTLAVDGPGGSDSVVSPEHIHVIEQSTSVKLHLPLLIK